MSYSSKVTSFPECDFFSDFNKIAITKSVPSFENSPAPSHKRLYPFADYSELGRWVNEFFQARPPLKLLGLDQLQARTICRTGRRLSCYWLRRRKRRRHFVACARSCHRRKTCRTACSFAVVDSAPENIVEKGRFVFLQKGRTR